MSFSNISSATKTFPSASRLRCRNDGNETKLRKRALFLLRILFYKTDLQNGSFTKCTTYFITAYCLH